MITAAEVKKIIEANLECSVCDVQGEDCVHFDAVIVSPAFSGLNMVKQHQLVYKTLGKLMQQEIHALQLKTYSPEQWLKKP
ncbi:MAG: BolA family protein [Burkholderiales bacterium]